ncbi:MAG: toprim domain-containing protein, partial [Burkholderiales bacterium]
GLRNVIPTYGTTGLTDEIVAHLVECRVKRVVLLMDADEAGCGAAVEMSKHLARVNIAARSMELPAKDAAEFIAAGGRAEQIRAIIESAPLNQLRQERNLYSTAASLNPQAPSGAACAPAQTAHFETSADGSMLFAIAGREYRVRGLSPVTLERLRVNVRLTLNGNFHLDTLDLYHARARAVFAQSAAKLCGVSEQQVSADLLQMIERLEAARLAMRKNGDDGTRATCQ